MRHLIVITVYSLLNELIIKETPDVDLICDLIKDSSVTNSGSSPNYLDITNWHGQTSLHLAVLVDLPHLVGRLLAAGASADACENRYGDNVALLACRLGRVKCFKAIIDGLKYRMDSTNAELSRVLRLSDREGCVWKILQFVLT